MRLTSLFALLCASRHAIAVIAAIEPASNNSDFLEKNKLEDGVVTLPSGLQYKVLSEGPTDGAHPKANDKCTCHYEGTLIDGSVFDSSRARDRPAVFQPSGVVKGWTEALQLMRPGDRWTLYVPAHLGYGAQGAGKKIPGGATLVFDLELISFRESSGAFGQDGVLETSLFGPVKVWHVALVLLMWWKFFSGGKGQVTASHILVEDGNLAKLKDVKVKLGKSKKVEKDFAVFAKKLSTCPSGKKGGSLGTFGRGQMVPEFDSVCWSAPVGEVQGPVKTSFGYHLILVTDRNDGAAPKED